MKNKKIREVLNFDGLHEAEKITGKSYKVDKMTESLGFMKHVQNGQIKKELLESLGDSTFSNTEENYLKIVQSIGFESELIEPFINGDGIEERLHIMWNKEHSILLVFDTHTWGDDGSWARSGNEVPPPNVNGGNFYYNWSPNAEREFGCTSTGGFIGNGDKKNSSYSSLFNEDFTPHILPEELRSIEPIWDAQEYNEYRENFNIWCVKVDEYVESKSLITIWSGHHDCREAIKFNINQLLENGKFVNKWQEPPFLWLLNYMDTKVDGYDYKEITKERLNKLPKYITKLINN